MQKLKWIWLQLDGLKMAIGALFYTFKDAIAPIWFKDGIPEPYNKIILTVAVLFTMTGFAHKIQKYKQKMGDENA